MLCEVLAVGHAGVGAGVRVEQLLQRVRRLRAHHQVRDHQVPEAAVPMGVVAADHKDVASQDLIALSSDVMGGCPLAT